MTHKIATDALQTLGTVLEPGQGRDAIHLAVICVEAGQTLRPAARVFVHPNGVATNANPVDSVGIVDPFLPDIVAKGQRFWCVLNPRTITSLRHVWSHPAFPDEPQGRQAITSDAEQAARLAIHALAEDLGVSDEAMMEGAAAWLAGHRYMHFGVDLSYGWDMPAFWSAYALLTGKDVPEDMRESFFRCSC